MKILVGAHAMVLGGAAFVLLDTVRALQSRYEVQIVVPVADGPLYHELDRLGIKIHVLPRKHWIPFPLAPLEGEDVTALRRLISDENIGLAITNTAIIAGLALAAAREEVPHIWYIHEALASNINVYPAIGPARCFSAITELSARVFTSSRNVRQEFLDYLPRESMTGCIESSTINVLYPALSDKYAMDKMPDLKSFARFTAIYCGVMSYNKGVDKLVLAADKIRRAIPSFHLLLVGMPGDATGFIVDAISRLQLENTVGVLPHSNDLQALVPRAHLAIYPSIRESFGLSILEAAASGIPVLATRSGGSEEVLEHFPATTWLASGDEEEIFTKVVELYQAYDESVNLARRSAPGIAKEFSYERFEKQLLDHIKEVIHLPPASIIRPCCRAMEDPYVRQDLTVPEGYVANFECESLTVQQRSCERKEVSQFVLKEIYKWCFERKTGFEDCAVVVAGDTLGSYTLRLAAAGLDVLYAVAPDSGSCELVTNCFASRNVMAERITVTRDIADIRRAIDFVVFMPENGHEVLSDILPGMTDGSLVFLCGLRESDVFASHNLVESYQFYFMSRDNKSLCAVYKKRSGNYRAPVSSG